MFPENTIIFEFDDGFYTAPDIAVSLKLKRTRAVTLPVLQVYLQSILVQSKKNIVFDTGSDAHEDNEASTTKVCILLPRELFGSVLLTMSNRLNALIRIIILSDLIP